MKKQILIGLISVSSILTVNAQTWIGSSDVNGNLWRNGNVGIGTTNPSTKFVVAGSKVLNFNPDRTAVAGIRTGSSFSYSGNMTLFMEDGVVGEGLDINYWNGSSYYPAFRVNNVASGFGSLLLMKDGGNVGIGIASPTYKVEWSNGTHTGFLDFTLSGSAIGSKNGNLGLWTSGNERIKILPNGNVGIGTEPLYKLDVKGTIRSCEVIVNTENGCDFVFKNDYKLMDLKNLEEFVKTNQHLPEIASEKEMVENGINMKELQMKLLQKMEEMTLYMIEQNKKIETLEKEIKELKTK